MTLSARVFSKKSWALIVGFKRCRLINTGLVTIGGWRVWEFLLPWQSSGKGVYVGPYKCESSNRTFSDYGTGL